MEMIISKEMDPSSEKKISYAQLRDKSYSIENDPYGIASFLTETIRTTLLANPFLDDNKTAYYLKLNNENVVGRTILLYSKFKINANIVDAQYRCSTEVASCCRGKGIGGSVVNYTLTNNESDIYISALHSTMMLPILKKKGLGIIDVPKYTKICNIKDILALRGFNGITLSLLSFLFSIPIKCVDAINRLKLKRLRKKYEIRQESIVPEWAGELATSGNYDYMEVHDTSWLQWNLDYNFNVFSRDKQSFYSIYNKRGNPIGFFMTKERFEERNGSNSIRGTVVEWDSSDKNELSEGNINLLALSTFSKDVSQIETITNNNTTARYIKQIGYLRHGSFQISFKCKNMKYEIPPNDKQWRIRYGYCNTIIL